MIKRELTIILAEDDEGHAKLIMRNLQRAGVMNKVLHFKDGEQVVEFLTKEKNEGSNLPALLLLDIKMPKMDGIEVLKIVKNDEYFKKMPVIMITTTDDPREIDLCHEIGCSNYIKKPIDYESFVDAIRKLGMFLLVVEIPEVRGTSA
jgi:CheY-like chemotaxis protein